jgi:ABC-type branched-subunit amino acid transport system ATPase component
MLSLSGVRVQIAGKPVLDGLDMEVASTEIVSLIGAPGCGKSTLLHAIFGLARVSDGSIRLEGVEIANQHWPRHKTKSTTTAESGRGIVSEMEGKYSVELFKEGGEGAGQEEIIDRHDNLTVARAIYRGRVSQYPGRLIMLCDRARVLARSDRPETMA